MSCGNHMQISHVLNCMLNSKFPQFEGFSLDFTFSNKAGGTCMVQNNSWGPDARKLPSSLPTLETWPPVDSCAFGPMRRYVLGTSFWVHLQIWILWVLMSNPANSASSNTNVSGGPALFEVPDKVLSCLCNANLPALFKNLVYSILLGISFLDYTSGRCLWRTMLFGPHCPPLSLLHSSFSISLFPSLSVFLSPRTVDPCLEISLESASRHQAMIWGWQTLKTVSSLSACFHTRNRM